MIPAIKPEKRGAPEASAIPKQRGKATKNTTKALGASCLRLEKGLWLTIGCCFL
jgi:hypothetical protein